LRSFASSPAPISTKNTRRADDDSRNTPGATRVVSSRDSRLAWNSALFRYDQGVI